MRSDAVSTICKATTTPSRYPDFHAMKENTQSKESTLFLTLHKLAASPNGGNDLRSGAVFRLQQMHDLWAMTANDMLKSLCDCSLTTTSRQAQIKLQENLYGLDFGMLDFWLWFFCKSTMLVPFRVFPCLSLLFDQLCQISSRGEGLCGPSAQQPDQTYSHSPQRSTVISCVCRWNENE